MLGIRLTQLNSLLAIPYCVHCNSAGSSICDSCLKDYPRSPEVCYSCNALSEHGQTCISCRNPSAPYSLNFVLPYGEMAKNLVGRLKVAGDRMIALAIAQQIYEHASVLQWIDNDSTVVTFVPTAPKRVRSRGFDHAQYIAVNFARLSELKLVKTLRRNNSTKQIGSGRAARRRQAMTTFSEVGNVDLTGKQVVLVDDVVVTGSTIEAATSLLKELGAKRIYVVCLSLKA